MIPVVAFCASFALWFILFTANDTLTMRRQQDEGRR